MLIYRRLALIAGARANVDQLARGWEVVIRGYIGHNPYKVGEYYRTSKEAQMRRRQVNHQGRALVVSIEEILFPLAMIAVKFDSSQLMPLPAIPPRQQALGEYSHVSEVYGR